MNNDFLFPSSCNIGYLLAIAVGNLVWKASSLAYSEGSFPLFIPVKNFVLYLCHSKCFCVWLEAEYCIIQNSLGEHKNLILELVLDESYSDHKP